MVLFCCFLCFVCHCFQFTGVLHHGVCDLITAEQPGDLGKHTVFGKCCQLCLRTILILLLFDQEMLIRHGCDLRQMRNADDLMRSAKDCQFFRYFPGSPATDARIDLIKDECLCFVLLCQHGFECQHDTGKLAAACYLRKRFLFLPCI